ncbi:unnamed protein product [Leptidea sinapis]|uniref:Uncharacterized protein n=1 Tax=Leptidea sinapis TaxID=189913 RepID=A0A5E4R3S4_9NEOP|nr:unnamed protein product [Leptidea sinapis]
MRALQGCVHCTQLVYSGHPPWFQEATLFSLLPTGRFEPHVLGPRTVAGWRSTRPDVCYVSGGDHFCDSTLGV